MHSYIHHLAQVNQIQPVFAMENICNVEGKVIIAQGTRIDHENAGALTGNKLAKPLVKLIELEDQFDVSQIRRIFYDYIAEEKSFTELHEARDFSEIFNNCIANFCQYPVLRQKLNIMALQLPEIFDQALFCGWLAATVLAEQNEKQVFINEVFIAALAHDFGILEVHPDIVFKKGALEPEEWQALQQHPTYSAQLIKPINCCSVATLRAINEHHERPDGTGYPKGKFEKQLGDIGQLLHMLDSTNAIFRKYFKSRDRSLCDLTPILQMSTLEHGGPRASALITMLKKTKATDHCTIKTDHIGDAIAQVKECATEIAEFVKETSLFSAEVGVKHKDLKIFELQNISKMISRALRTCGIINTAYLRWLDQVEKEKLEFAYRELEDVLLMTQEVKFHMARYDYQVNLYLLDETKAHTPQVKSLKQSLDEIKSKYKEEKDLSTYLDGI